MDRVLFSPVGNSDPVRGNHDGPLLHIIRHYKPRIVYLYLTKEMEKYYSGETEFPDEDNNGEILDNRYIEAVQKLQSQLGYMPEFSAYKSGIENAHDYDEIFKSIEKCIKHIKNKHPQSQILLNISSGTPQISTALLVEAINSEKPLKAIQVATFRKASNSDQSAQNCNIIEEIKNLKDDNHTENRCHEPGVKNFRKAFIISKLIPLLRQYNYQSCLELFEDSSSLFENSRLISSLLEHCACRVKLQKSRAKEALEKLDCSLDFNFYPENENNEDIVEYYNTAVIKFKQQEITDFILRLTPLLTGVTESLVNKYIPLDQIGEDDNGVYNFKRDMIQQYDPNLLIFMDHKCRGVNGRESFKEGFLNLFTLNHILSYIPELKNKNHNQLCQEGFYEARKVLKEFRAIEEKARNKAAHQMLLITDDFLKKHISKSSSEIMEKLKRVMGRVYPGSSCTESFIYDDINNIIIINLR